MATLTGSFSGRNIPGPVAVEIAAQVAASTGNATALSALGVPPALARKAAAAITTSSISALTLANLVNYPSP